MGRSPGSGEISVTDPKYRQNMIANKFYLRMISD